MIDITKDNFESEIDNAKGTVLLDFWASWCGPCKMLAPVIKEIADEEKDIKVCKVNVDEQPELATAFHVASIPTLFVIKNGKVTDSTAGVRSKDDILKMLK